MVMFAKQRRRPGARGMYPGSGVAQGGNTRRRAMFMGTSKVKKGGKARIGSKIVSNVPNAATGRPGAGRPPVSGAIPYPTSSPGNLFHLNPGTALDAPKPGTPGSAKPMVTPVSYKGPQWLTDMAQANASYLANGADIQQLGAQYQMMIPANLRAVADLDKWRQQNIYDTNASLAARGLSSSGEVVNTQVGRQDEYGRNWTDIYNSVGYGAQKGALDRIAYLNQVREAQRAADEMQANTNAFNEALTNVYQNPPATPAAAAAAGTAQVRLPGGGGAVRVPASTTATIGGKTVTTPKAKTYRPGAYFSGGKWFYVNAQGNTDRITAAKAAQFPRVNAPWNQ